MGKVQKIVAAAAVGMALGAASAQAQTSNNTLSASSLLNSLSASNVSSMLSDYSITTQMVADPSGGSPVMVATTPGGAKFLIGFFECTAPATASGCSQTLVSTVLPSAGVTAEELNTFNGNSFVTTVAYEASENILVFGRNIYSLGGIGRDNFKVQVELFLEDMQGFVRGRQASTTSVLFRKRPALNSKIDSFNAQQQSPNVRIVVSEPGQADGKGSKDFSKEVNIAISNSLDVSFTNGSKGFDMRERVNLK